MAISQNGYTCDPGAIRVATVDNTDVRVSIRSGPAGDLLLWAAARWHHEVEPLRAPDGVLDCWGYAPRTVRGSATILSNHASGTALDLRARSHPLGVDPARTFTAEQRATVRRICADARGALRWGGDYTGRKDGMHLEVIADEARCAWVLGQLHAAAGRPASLPRLQQGSRGPAVETLQRWLNGHDWTPDLPVLAVDGDWGPATTRVLRAAQQQCGIPDGDGTTLGPKTRAALYARGFPS